jgi:hypothetical protein
VPGQKLFFPQKIGRAATRAQPSTRVNAGQTDQTLGRPFLLPSLFRMFHLPQPSCPSYMLSCTPTHAVRGTGFRRVGKSPSVRSCAARGWTAFGLCVSPFALVAKRTGSPTRARRNPAPPPTPKRHPERRSARKRDPGRRLVEPGGAVADRSRRTSLCFGFAEKASDDHFHGPRVAFHQLPELLSIRIDANRKPTALGYELT